jgi:cold shock CspA family protein
MLNGTIVTESNGKGWWIVECDGTSECLFVHHSQVAHNRYLHVGDRIRFDSAPNPRKPGQNCAINVEYVGRVVARQTSAVRR